MIFRQMFEAESSTYTYLFGCTQTGQAILLDPVLETMERDLQVLQALGLHLVYTLETHIHADHVTSAYKLKSVAGSRIAGPAMDQLPCTDFGTMEGQAFRVGTLTFSPLFTPGHTDTHHSYLLSEGDSQRVFTGDALLIDGCGRTDFQNGDAATLYRSIRDKLFSLPDETLIYPAHDYQHRHVSSVAQEKGRNPRLASKSVKEFQDIMANLNLAYPKKIDYAVPANRQCGECPTELPENMRRLCDPSPQG